MTEKDNQEQLADKHRSDRPLAEPGKETTPPVGYMADVSMKKVALRGALATIEGEFADKADKPSPRQLMRMAVEQYRKSLKSKPAPDMLG